ncbi:MAG: type II toxin-antitoxin system Phd/YefM family antitoxin [Egibacteraceae bacterium]
MVTYPLGAARDKLSEILAEVERTHERVVITRHGRAIAVILSPDDLESLEETLDILSSPGALEEIQEARAAIARGEVYSLEQVETEVAQRRPHETGAA